VVLGWINAALIRASGDAIKVHRSRGRLTTHLDAELCLCPVDGIISQCHPIMGRLVALGWSHNAKEWCAVLQPGVRPSHR
jgi:hypothetical protein